MQSGPAGIVPGFRLQARRLWRRPAGADRRGGWTDRVDLAEAFVVWGGYAYGAGEEGKPARELFEQRLSTVEAVVQNQDNREHDLLDSDDYYQFEGGMTAAVEAARGSAARDLSQ
jgi:cobalamin biosynthesis Mg chelatase CobN